MPRGSRRRFNTEAEVARSAVVGYVVEADLARSWRRVASTHALQLLIAPDDPAPVRKSVSAKIKGLLMLTAALSIAVLHLAHAVALWLPPAHLPPLLRLMKTHSQLLFHIAFAFHGTAIAAFIHWFSLKLFKHNSS